MYWVTAAPGFVLWFGAFFCAIIVALLCSELGKDTFVQAPSFSWRCF